MTEIEQKAARGFAEQHEIKLRDLQSQLTEKAAALGQSKAEQLKLMKLGVKPRSDSRNSILKMEQKVSAQLEKSL